ncbi:metallothionein expression activator [Rhypophila sp. PSN 637]
MSTPAPALKLEQVRSDELYDSDDAIPRDSPLLKPIRPKLEPSPTPPPEQPLTVSSPPSPSPGKGKKKSNRRRMKKHKVTQADVVLLRNLGGQEEIARDALRQTLPSDSEDSCSGASESDYSSIGGESSPESQPADKIQSGDRSGKVHLGDFEEKRAPSEDPGGDMGAFDLKSLAAGALAFASPKAPPEIDAGPTPPVTEHDVVKGRPPSISVPSPITTRRLEHTQEPRHHAALSPYSPPSIPPSLYSPREPSALPQRSPQGLPSGGHPEGSLPPLQQLNSPRSDVSGPTRLPPITHLGDFYDHQKERERLRSQNSFPVSPPSALPRFPQMQHGHHASPPISPAETFRRDPLSPNHSIASATSPGFHYPQTNGLYRPTEYASPQTETPGSDQQGPTPATIADRMSIDGLTHATYMCTFPQCNAPAFQTQYLLNSHMNVHSSARPHYCPVPNCPRSEGGKGFKRKNEMIRHGLVHESPGYVCPFCPDREHKYPRPDNLQRHVRVHHVDKDKDDPALRDVLAQRPDGPSRGRRRRGGPN